MTDKKYNIVEDYKEGDGQKPFKDREDSTSRGGHAERIRHNEFLKASEKLGRDGGWDLN